MFSSQNSQVSNDAVFVEDVFQTFLYTGTSSTQTITNGIDLAGDGGLVWTKMRNTGAFGNSDHWLFDTARGVEKKLSTNTTDAQGATSGALQQFNANGYQLGYTGGGYYELNYTGNTYASWTFRKQPKFFDVVTYTGNGTARTIAHNLGSAPGFYIVKRTDTTSNWSCYHRSLGNGGLIDLNSTSDASLGNGRWNFTSPTSTVFSVSDDPSVNGSGGTYVAYLFAHDAGGFGLTGTDNVISCGSYTGTGAAGNTITLGYEPQWLLIKDTTTAFKWMLIDNMRGFSMGTSSAVLSPNSSDAETANGSVQPTATGFTLTGGGGFVNGSGDNYIYIAIRRGPMKVPTSGTSVLQTLTYTGNGSSGRIYSGVTTVPDLAIATSRSNTSPKNWCDRLRGENPMISTSTDGESGTSQEGKTIIAGSANGTVTFGSYWGDAAVNTNGYTYVNYLLSRAPSFFDEVCYTGTGSATTVTHNLGVVPEMIIAKNRNSTYPWGTYHSALGTSQYVRINSTAASDAFALFPSVSSTTFGVSADPYNNGSGLTYVAYLFATCAGVSKVGSYTGTGTTLQVNCGFTSGARFVLIKRTDSTGDWYVWDSARGIVSGNDPYLLLNSTAAETTGTDYIDPYSAGFEISSTAPAAINASGGTFIFLAIA